MNLSMIKISLIGLIIRLLLILYSIYFDAIAKRDGNPTYTDIDYVVVTDAAKLIADNQSPYNRQTYRYTPILAWIVLPNILLNQSVGKVLFSVADILIGISIKRINKKLYPNHNSDSILSSFLWILNPFVISISTRGSPESIIGLLVMSTLDALVHEKYTVAAVMMAFSVHYKIYPFIYVTSILSYIWYRKRSFKAIIKFSIISLTVFGVINGLLYYL